MNYLTLFEGKTLFNKLLPLLDLRAQLDLRLTFVRLNDHHLLFFAGTITSPNYPEGYPFAPSGTTEDLGFLISAFAGKCATNLQNQVVLWFSFVCPLVVAWFSFGFPSMFFKQQRHIFFGKIIH